MPATATWVVVAVTNVSLLAKRIMAALSLRAEVSMSALSRNI
jgi:hypothetical protein